MTGAGTVQSSSPIGFETLYAGYRWDNPAPQMYYVRNRFLLPQIGTWNKRDPVRFNTGESNLFRYVGGNPIVWVDSQGLYRQDPQWPHIPHRWIIDPLLTYVLGELNKLKGICACELAVSGIPAAIDKFVPLPPAPHGKPNWPWQHCTSNCVMVATCGGDERAVRCAARLSLLKELLDVIACYLYDHGNGDSCDSAFQASDFDDNSAGRTNGTNCDKTVILDKWPFLEEREDSCTIDQVRCCVTLCALRNPIGQTQEGPGTRKPYGPFAGPGINGSKRAGHWPTLEQITTGLF